MAAAITWPAHTREELRAGDEQIDAPAEEAGPDLRSLRRLIKRAGRDRPTALAGQGELHVGEVGLLLSSQILDPGEPQQ